MSSAARLAKESSVQPQTSTGQELGEAKESLCKAYTEAMPGMSSDFVHPTYPRSGCLADMVTLDGFSIMSTRIRAV